MDVHIVTVVIFSVCVYIVFDTSCTSYSSFARWTCLPPINTIFIISHFFKAHDLRCAHIQPDVEIHHSQDIILNSISYFLHNDDANLVVTPLSTSSLVNHHCRSKYNSRQFGQLCSLAVLFVLVQLSSAETPIE